MTTPANRFPSPFVLLVGCILLAAALTWILPAGRYERRPDPVTGRDVVVRTAVKGQRKVVAQKPVADAKAGAKPDSKPAAKA